MITLVHGGNGVNFHCGMETLHGHCMHCDTLIKHHVRSGSSGIGNELSLLSHRKGGGLLYVLSSIRLVLYFAIILSIKCRLPCKLHWPHHWASFYRLAHQQNLSMNSPRIWELNLSSVGWKLLSSGDTTCWSIFKLCSNLWGRAVSELVIVMHWQCNQWNLITNFNICHHICARAYFAICFFFPPVSECVWCDWSPNSCAMCGVTLAGWTLPTFYERGGKSYPKEQGLLTTLEWNVLLSRCCQVGFPYRWCLSQNLATIFAILWHIIELPDE